MALPSRMWRTGTTSRLDCWQQANEIKGSFATNIKEPLAGHKSAQPCQALILASKSLAVVAHALAWHVAKLHINPVRLDAKRRLCTT